ncbi:GAF domain-containing protein [Rhizobium sp. XQZ8]|uniref:GAF domain-containing protein n=1 Tax=Rhizobium populisoli TaxID=2859785 RepID=UPI001CA5141D|nr:GAF domain-containing protein [Rhizobium populisoli]MBW6426021.1 GAF domain-containing protein [Rhizobium populisoli]
MTQEPFTDNQVLDRRLELLEAYNVLNTPAEPEFDDIVLIASEACRTPVSLVSLVEDDRQWFKARIGFEACETPLDQSVCAHSLSSPDLLIIPDLALDVRTRNNTLVTDDPHIRFYAGAPLVSPEGIAIGTLCVIDTVPRPEGLDASQRRILTALARQVIVHLEARRLSHRKDELFKRQKGVAANIRADAHRNMAAQEAGRIGTFEIDIATGTVSTSPEFCRIFDVPVASTYPTSTFEAMAIDQGIQSTDATRADGSALTDVEYRIKTPLRGIRWVSRQATFDRDERGRPVTMRGTAQDVTFQKRSVLRVQALLDLGDRLRELDAIEDMTVAASDLMGKALDAVRAGFGIVDYASESIVIHPDWHAPGYPSVAGRHFFRDYGAIIGDVNAGKTVAISDVGADLRLADRAERLIGLGAKAIVLVPILDHGRFNLMAFVHFDEPRKWTDDELNFVRNFGDRVQSAIARRNAEAEQALMNREIGHRLKNSFAMVQAIATQTLRPVTERQHVTAFQQRLFALSKAHDILLNEQVGAPFGAIVASLGETLGMEGRLLAEGPPVMLGSRGALSLGLLLHELGTNALKYGAFSVPEGIVSAKWVVDGSGTEPMLRFSWSETGGPPPKLPTSRGFGTKLIQMGLIGTGAVTVSYEPPGFSAKMSASLQQLQQAN